MSSRGENEGPVARIWLAKPGRHRSCRRLTTAGVPLHMAAISEQEDRITRTRLIGGRWLLTGPMSSMGQMSMRRIRSCRRWGSVITSMTRRRVGRRMSRAIP
jgi:hypothetical protein